MSANGIHISISAEKLFDLGGVPITNSIFTSLIVSAGIILFAIAVRSQISFTGKPKGLQNFAEWIIEALHNLTHSVTGDLKKTRLFFPFIASFFLFILLNNWFGLLPGVGTIYKVSGEQTTEAEHASSIVEQAHAETIEETHVEPILDDHAETTEVGTSQIEEVAHSEETAGAEEAEHAVEKVPVFRAGTADLNTTIALALISVIVTQGFGVHYLGASYFKKYINFSSPIMFFVGALELVLEFAKIMSFAFRLFGNIFAGEVLLVVIAFLIPVIAPMPFYGLELFVGFIQALVFAMLSLVFFNMATIGHDEH